MPITPYLRRENAFGPDVVRDMSVAFLSICEALGLTDHTPAAKEAVALRIIELASLGEHDPVRLKTLVLKQYSPEPTKAQP